MKSILEEFAKGNILFENQSFEQDSEFGEAMKTLVDYEKQPLSQLRGDDKTLLEKYIDAQGEVTMLTAIKNLVYGYRLGLLMTAEAFFRSDEMILGDQ
ncbi:hypothetical protein AGMMS49975_08520 [Clostridia bacterium]|nr:hypothetical protein AGMMS49975_08520 [Clostridia bacterium]